MARKKLTPIRAAIWYGLELPIRFILLTPFIALWKIGEASERAVWWLDKVLPSVKAN